ncbi:ammonium transporter [Paenibacillus sp. 481]|uniref:ammonium transporter n=1 Tax=Paenibacillus sp. 481 TaxID=2835869 RepID=UPI001E3BDA8F|nr:ammonium transporter [Paenibacillus sp. 481]UHA72608.1 ammonium transporter [Paenibacillus sp. 481]
MAKKWHKVRTLSLLTVIGIGGFIPQLAQAAGEATNAQLKLAVDAVWIMLAAILVIMMQAGFALLEAGTSRMKNAGHVAGKTVLMFGLCAITFWMFGFGFGFGNGNGIIGTTGFFFSGDESTAAEVYSSLAFSDVPIAIKFLFQFAFAAVSLAIACGGLAERAKLSVYVIFGILFTVVIYPVAAHWVWGGGWLAELGMQDFAGSAVVHMQGATAALVATIMLKPRLGKYGKDGRPNLIPGHNQVFSVLGVLLLWVGWFGFNPGSTLTAVNDGFFGYVALTTNLAAAAGAVVALLVSWMVLGKADIPSMLNGVLAALVAITGACAFVEPWAAIVIGAVAGALTFFTAQWFERKGVDDPVYAFSVHGMAGIWGALSTGFFAAPHLVETVGVGKAGLFYGGGFEQLFVQAVGIAGVFVFVAILSIIMFAVMKRTIGLRVTEEEEIMGLDMSEHGEYGYPEQMKAINNVLPQVAVKSEHQEQERGPVIGRLS